jgi:hypothetical protein
MLGAVMLMVLLLYLASPFPAPVDALSRDPAPLVQKLGKPDVSVNGNASPGSRQDLSSALP